MTSRLLAVLAAASLVAAVPAEAKPRPASPASCVVDAQNDDRWLPGPAVLHSPALDIVAAQILVGGRTITTIVQVAGWSGTADLAATGAAWEFHWTGGDGTVVLSTVAAMDARGQMTFRYTRDGRSGSVPGRIDTARGEIRVSVPVAEVDAPPRAAVHRRGDVLRDLRAYSRWTPTGAVVDQAISPPSTVYVVGEGCRFDGPPVKHTTAPKGADPRGGR